MLTISSAIGKSISICLNQNREFYGKLVKWKFSICLQQLYTFKWVSLSIQNECHFLYYFLIILVDDYSLNFNRTWLIILFWQLVHEVVSAECSLRKTSATVRPLRSSVWYCLNTIRKRYLVVLRSSAKHGSTGTPQRLRNSWRRVLHLQTLSEKGEDRSIGSKSGGFWDSQGAIYID